MQSDALIDFRFYLCRIQMFTGQHFWRNSIFDLWRHDDVTNQSIKWWARYLSKQKQQRAALISQNNILQQTRVFLDLAEYVAEYKSGDRNDGVLSKIFMDQGGGCGGHIKIDFCIDFKG